jgi:CRP/FNR family cyclic AMP-dependent transcriptional regulator
MASPILCEKLLDFPLFHGMTLDQVEKLQSRFQVRCLNSGTQLLTADHFVRFNFIVLTGSLKLKTLRLDGNETTIALLGPGEVLSESVMGGDSDDGFLLETIESCTLLSVSCDIFNEWLWAIPILSYNFSQLMATRLRITSQYLQAAYGLDVAGRVAHRLLTYANLYGYCENGSNKLVIPLRITQGDLAQLTGASRVSVNQTLNTFKRLGYIQMNSSRLFVISNAEGLARLCYTK